MAAKMKVSVQMRIWNPINEDHIEMMKFCARILSCNPETEEVLIEEYGEFLVAHFCMNKAREMDVVDKIMKRFRCYVPDSDDCTIWFPKPRRIRKSRRKSPQPDKTLARQKVE